MGILSRRAVFCLPLANPDSYREYRDVVLDTIPIDIGRKRHIFLLELTIDYFILADGITP